MKHLKTLFILFAITANAQIEYERVYNGGAIPVMDNLYNSKPKDGVIIAQKKYNYFDVPRYGKITNSYESSSDHTAIWESTYKSDYLPRFEYQTTDEKIGEAIVRGANGIYYKVDLYRD